MMPRKYTARLMVGFLALLLSSWMGASAQAQRNDIDRVMALADSGKLGQAASLAQKLVSRIKRKFGANHTNHAIAINLLAWVRDKQGRHLDAIPLYKKAIRIRERKSGPKSPKIVNSLILLASAYSSLKRYDESISQYRRVLHIQERELGAEHPKVASTLIYLADAYNGQSRFADAIALLKRAVDIREKNFGKSDSGLSDVLRRLANAYANLARYAEAVPLYKRSIRIQESAVGPADSSLISALQNLGVVYVLQGKYEEGIEVAKRALKISEDKLGDEHPRVADSLINLANAYFKQARYAAAIPLYKRALEIEEATSGSSHQRTADTLNNLGLAYSKQNQKDLSVLLFQKALKIQKERLGPQHPSLAKTLQNLAGIYSEQSRYAEATPLYEQALEIWQKKLGPSHPDTALALQDLALSYKGQRRFDEAASHYRRALEIQERKLGPGHPDVALTLNNLANLYLNLGDLKRAEPMFKRSLGIRQERLGPDHPYVATSLIALASFYSAQGKYLEAYEYLTESLSISERLADRSALPKSYNKANSEDVQSTSGFVVKTGWALTRQDPENREVVRDETFRAAQSAISGSTSRALAQMAVRFASGRSDLGNAIRERQDLIRQWRKIDKALLTAVSAVPGKRRDAKIAALRTQLSDADGRISSLSAMLRKEFPKFVELSNPRPLAIKDTQKLLQEDEAMLLFLLGRDWSLVWAVTRDAVAWRKIDVPLSEISDRIKALRGSLSMETLASDSGALFNLQTAHQLYRDLIVPVEDLIRNKKNLLVVPSGALTGLPFHVLLTAKPEVAVPADVAGYREASWLLKRHAVTVLPSVSSLKALRVFARKGNATKPMVGYGDPVFGDGKGAGAVRGAKVAGLKTRAFDSFFTQGGLVDIGALGNALPALPDTADELRHVARRLGASDEAIRLGREASEANVKASDLSRYRVVYFATHGLVAGDLAKLGSKVAEPALALTSPKRVTAADDGLLTASEVAQLKLNADWVILSACNTAAGDKPGAEALSGLAKAFIYAGARSLLVSHWPVLSDAAVKLTSGLFDAKGNEPGISKAEALRRSMLAMVNDTSDPSNAYPAVWAPFVVVGGGER